MNNSFLRLAANTLGLVAGLLSCLSCLSDARAQTTSRAVLAVGAINEHLERQGDIAVKFRDAGTATRPETLYRTGKLKVEGCRLKWSQEVLFTWEESFKQAGGAVILTRLRPDDVQLKPVQSDPPLYFVITKSISIPVRDAAFGETIAQAIKQFVVRCADDKKELADLKKANDILATIGAVISAEPRVRYSVRRVNRGWGRAVDESRYEEVLSNVRLETCVLKYMRTTRNGERAPDAHEHELTLDSLDPIGVHAQRLRDPGNNAWEAGAITPEVWVVKASKSISGDHDWILDLVGDMKFSSEENAQKVAAALKEASKVCGGEAEIF